MLKCLSPGCSGQTSPGKLATCTVCRRVNCHSCHAIHEGLPCRLYQESIGGGEKPDRRGKTTKVPVKTETLRQDEGAAKTEAGPSVTVDVPQDANSERLVTCFKATCDGQGFVDRTDVLFKCPLCNHFNCLECEAIHESLTCNQYKQKKGEPRDALLEGTAETVDDQDDLEEQEVEEPDDWAEGRIVNCKAEGCTGHGYVDKTATISECFACKRWTCVRCNACHESKSCAQYKRGGDGADEEVVEVPTDDTAGPLGETHMDVGHTGSSDKREGMVRRLRTKVASLFQPGGAGQDKQKEPENWNAVASGGHETRQTRAQAGKIAPHASAGGKTVNVRKVENQGLCECCYKQPHNEILPDCEHEVCTLCITTAVKSTITYEVMCPAKQKTVTQCRGNLPENVIKKNVPKDVYKLWKSRKSWDRIPCRKCKTELLKDPQKTTLKCPRCQMLNCLECSAVHEGLTCTEYIEKVVRDIDRGVNEDPEEKKRRYQEQLNLYNQDAIQATEEFDCAICFTTVQPDMGLILKNCHHQICKDCLINTAKNSSSALVKCPHDPCEMEISDTELRACLPPEHYEELQERGLREAERTSQGSFHCKTVDCKGWCIHEEGPNTFDCPVCKKINCLRCEAIHDNMNCAQYQEDLRRRAENDDAARASVNMLEAELEKGEAMRCSNCRVILIKRGGCDAIQCASCNTELCWATKGPRWGPRGKGDISGGCRCGVNGEKCHPTCAFCH